MTRLQINLIARYILLIKYYQKCFGCESNKIKHFLLTITCKDIADYMHERKEITNNTQDKTQDGFHHRTYLTYSLQNAICRVLLKLKGKAQGQRI
jgi:hypothetical protein